MPHTINSVVFTLILKPKWIPRYGQTQGWEEKMVTILEEYAQNLQKGEDAI